MLVARLHGVADLRVADEPAPVAEAGLSLVRVTAVGICGSDLHWWADAGIGDAVLQHPVVPGHEAAGVIEQGPRRGERVAIDPAIACGACRSCASGYRNLCVNIQFAGHGSTDGAMREYLTWPSHLLHRLPDSLTDADGALLEPLGVAIHAADLGHLKLAGSAAVVGCGPLGLLLIQVLLAGGAASVIAYDPLPHRLEAASRVGAQVLADPVGMTGVDVAFELAGTDAGVQLAMSAVRPGGRVVLGGIPSEDRISFQASSARRKGLTIAMVRRMNETYPRAISLACAGKVDLSIVSHRFPLSMAQDAFGLAATRSGHKIVIEPADRASAEPSPQAGTHNGRH